MSESENNQENQIHIHRKSYTASFKCDVIAYAEVHGNRRAANFYQVNERSVRLWRTTKTVLETMNKNRRTMRRRKPKFQALEDELEQMVKVVRDQELQVSTSTIARMARGIAREKNIINFTAPPAWVFRFMKRKRLCMRAITTTVVQKLGSD
ncbi:hypothetical protein ENBRE01_2091 [Enteropsectra breve]|nr:hypothetical protein ENBRE01_2091 [Enteropsectra breve]